MTLLRLEISCGDFSRVHRVRPLLDEVIARERLEELLLSPRFGRNSYVAVRDQHNPFDACPTWVHQRSSEECRFGQLGGGSSPP